MKINLYSRKITNFRTSTSLEKEYLLLKKQAEVYVNLVDL